MSVRLRLAVLVLALTYRAALASDLIGQATVIDGDTLEIHGTRIRLFGIDAPESSQLCRGDDSLPYRCGAGEWTVNYVASRLCRVYQPRRQVRSPLSMKPCEYQSM